jgi:hypothetical protein
MKCLYPTTSPQCHNPEDCDMENRIMFLNIWFQFTVRNENQFATFAIPAQFHMNVRDEAVPF